MISSLLRNSHYFTLAIIYLFSWTERDQLLFLLDALPMPIEVNAVKAALKEDFWSCRVYLFFNSHVSSNKNYYVGVQTHLRIICSYSDANAVRNKSDSGQLLPLLCNPPARSSAHAVVVQLCFSCDTVMLLGIGALCIVEILRNPQSLDFQYQNTNFLVTTVKK